MEIKCDVCGSTEGVQCEIMTKGDRVDRIYHLCPEHWIEVYRECLESFLDHNPYKVNSFLKVAADRLIINQLHFNKMVDTVAEDKDIDINAFEPCMVRVLRTYDDNDLGGEANE